MHEISVRCLVGASSCRCRRRSCSSCSSRRRWGCGRLRPLETSTLERPLLHRCVVGRCHDNVSVRSSSCFRCRCSRLSLAGRRRSSGDRSYNTRTGSAQLQRGRRLRGALGRWILGSLSDNFLFVLRLPTSTATKKQVKKRQIHQNSKANRRSEPQGALHGSLSGAFLRGTLSPHSTLPRRR
jgi:hypothetical protein